MDQQPIQAFPDTVRTPYSRDLYVERTGLHTGGTDPADEIAHWIRNRVSNEGACPILRLQAPPGYGKSWAIKRFLDRFPAQSQDAPLLILGPLTPLPDYTPQWWRTCVEDLGVGASLNAVDAQARSALQNQIVALVNYLEHLQPPRHLLVIVDDVDQAVDLGDLEDKLLGPIANLALKHAVSLLIAVRSDFGFVTVEPLRRQSQFLLFPIAAFDRDQAVDQVTRLLGLHGGLPAIAGTAALIIDSLPGSYTWGIPALNAALVDTGVAKLRSSAGLWTPVELARCVVLALRLSAADDPELLNRAICFRRFAFPNGWRLADVQKAFGWGEPAAAKFRDRLYALNLIERPKGTSFGTYQISSDWNSIFEVLQLVSATDETPL